MAEAVVVGRKPKQGNLVANENIAIWVDTQDAWYKKKKYRRILPPWAKKRGGWTYIKENYPNTMYQVTTTFKTIAEATRDWERWIRRETIAKALKGKSFGGKPKKKGKKVTSAEIAAALALVK